MSNLSRGLLTVSWIAMANTEVGRGVCGTRSGIEPDLVWLTAPGGSECKGYNAYQPQVDQTENF